MKKLLLSVSVLFFLSCDKEEIQKPECDCFYLKEYKHVTTYPDGTVTDTGWATYGETKPADCDSEEIVFLYSVEYPNSYNTITVSDYRWVKKCN